MKWIFLFLILISCSNNEDMRLFQTSLTSGGEAPPIKPIANVLLVTGQSNADGRGRLSFLQPIDIGPDALVQSYQSASDEFLDMEIGVTNNNQANFELYHGLEAGLNRYGQDYYDDPIYVVKYCFSNTEMTRHLSGGDVYEPFWNDYVKPAINNLLSQGYNVNILGLVFVQGEADGNEPNSSLYPSRLDEWYALWKTNLGDALPFNIVEIVDYAPDPIYADRNVRYGIINGYHADKVAIESNAVLVETDLSFGLRDDEQHYDWDGQRPIAEQTLINVKNNLTGLLITSPL